MLTQKRLVSRAFVFLLMLVGICEGRGMKGASQSAEQEAMPIIKYLEYGFGVLDITRGLEGKAEGRLSF